MGISGRTCRFKQEAAERLELSAAMAYQARRAKRFTRSTLWHPIDSKSPQTVIAKEWVPLACGRWGRRMFTCRNTRDDAWRRAGIGHVSRHAAGIDRPHMSLKSGQTTRL